MSIGLASRQMANLKTKVLWRNYKNSQVNGFFTAGKLLQYGIFIVYKRYLWTEQMVT